MGVAPSKDELLRDGREGVLEFATVDLEVMGARSESGRLDRIVES